MPDTDDRRAALIAAAVADELTAAERAELDALRRDDPTIDGEITQMRELSGALRSSGLSWEPASADDALRARVLAGLADESETLQAAPLARVPDAGRGRAVAGRRRPWLLPLVAAACLVVGVGVGAAVPPLLSPAPSGPPGTLGALETADVRDDLAGATIEVEIVAHTWGTEAILDATGLESGTTYEIVLIARDGSEHSAGAMLGSEVPIHCSVNAAVLRGDVSRLEIREGSVGVIAIAELPTI